MTHNVRVAASRSRPQRFPRRLRLFCWAVGVVCAVAACGSSVSDNEVGQVVSQLPGLVAENGLLRRPGLPPDGAPSLTSTYYAAVIANTVDAAPWLLKEPTLSAVRELVPLAREKGAISDLLMSAVVLRYAGEPDAALEKEAGDLAREWLAGGVSRGNVVPAAQVFSLLQQLGQQFDQVAGSSFPIRDLEDRYLAWTMLSISHHLSNGEQVQRELATATREVMTVLRAPDALPVREVTLAMRVPGSGLDRNDLPAPLMAWAGAVRGCDGYPDLYRPLRAEARCSLEATAQMIAAGLTSPTT